MEMFSISGWYLRASSSAAVVGKVLTRYYRTTAAFRKDGGGGGGISAISPGRISPRIPDTLVLLLPVSCIGPSTTTAGDLT